MKRGASKFRVRYPSDINVSKEFLGELSEAEERLKAIYAKAAEFHERYFHYIDSPIQRSIQVVSLMNYLIRIMDGIRREKELMRELEGAHGEGVSPHTRRNPHGSTPEGAVAGEASPSGARREV